MPHQNSCELTYWMRRDFLHPIGFLGRRDFTRTHSRCCLLGTKTFQYSPVICMIFTHGQGWRSLVWTTHASVYALRWHGKLGLCTDQQKEITLYDFLTLWTIFVLLLSNLSLWYIDEVQDILSQNRFNSAVLIFMDI